MRGRLCQSTGLDAVISALKDLLNVSERTIFSKVKSSMYCILSNLIPVPNSGENVSLSQVVLPRGVVRPISQPETYLHF